MTTVDPRVKLVTINDLIAMGGKCGKCSGKSCTCFDNVNMLTRKLCDELPVKKRNNEFDSVCCSLFGN